MRVAYLRSSWALGNKYAYLPTRQICKQCCRQFLYLTSSLARTTNTTRCSPSQHPAHLQCGAVLRVHAQAQRLHAAHSSDIPKTPETLEIPPDAPRKNSRRTSSAVRFCASTRRPSVFMPRSSSSRPKTPKIPYKPYTPPARCDSARPRAGRASSCRAAAATPRAGR